MDDLKGVEIGPGNVLAKLESEVAVYTTPSDFADKASISVSASRARDVLNDMGVSIPSMISSNGALDTLLNNTPRLTPQQIDLFVRLVQLN